MSEAMEYLMKFQFNDGGRAAAGYSGKTGDCACRAIAIAAEIPYQQAYDLINQFSACERKSKGKNGRSSASSGVFSATLRRVMDSLGWQWVACMSIGTGCKVHLRSDELPSGRIITRVSKHYCAVLDGVIHDTHDCSRNGTRCVYGYWIKP